MKIRIGFGMIATTFTIVMVVPLVSCVPTTKFWQINPDPGRELFSSSLIRKPNLLTLILVPHL